MALPVIEQITRDVVQALSGVTISSGYNTDLIVERPLQRGNEYRDSLAVVVQDAVIKADRRNNCQTKWRQTYAVKCYVLESETSDVSVDERINFIRSDVERALMIDHHRGGKAIDTELAEPEYLLDESDSGKVVGIQVIFDVIYWTDDDNPYEQ